MIEPNRIVFATDGSADTDAAAGASVDLANEAGAGLHVVHAWRDTSSAAYSGMDVASHLQHYVREADALLEEQVAKVRAAGGEVAGAHLREGRPAEKIAELADELDAGLVVLGSRGLGTVKRLVVGSVSGEVVLISSRPTLVVRGGAWPPRRLLVGDDGSETSRRAGEVAAAIAGAYGCPLLLLRAVSTRMLLGATRRTSHDPGAPDELMRSVKESLRQRAEAVAPLVGERPGYEALVGPAASLLQSAAEDGNGERPLLVVGSRGPGGLGRFRLGSVSSDVLHAVEGSVLVVPPAGDDDDQEGPNGHADPL